MAAVELPHAYSHGVVMHGLGGSDISTVAAEIVEWFYKQNDYRECTISMNGVRMKLEKEIGV